MFVLKTLVRVVSSLVGAALVLSTAACGQNVSGPASVPTSADISAAIGTTGRWKLQSLTRPDATTVAVSEPDRFTFELSDSTGRIAVRADCNVANGGFTVKGNTLSLGLLAITRAYCASAPLDEEYVRILQGDSVVTIAGSSLQLASSRGTLRFNSV